MSAARALRRALAAPVWAWLLLALALRLGFALRLDGRQHQTDEVGYSEPARQLAATGVLGTRGQAQVMPPAAFAFYAAFFSMGESLLWPRLGLAFLGTLVCWLLMRMTRALTGSDGAARLALALSCVYPFFIYWGGMVMSETPYLACVCAALWWSAAALSGGRKAARWAAGAGLAWALAALCRTEALPVALAVLLLFCVLWEARRFSAGPAIAFALALALPLAGWAARNKAVSGKLALDVHGGISLLHGTEFFDLNEIDTEKAMQAIYPTDFYKRAQSVSEVERDAVFRDEALSWMSAHKGEVVRQWGRKFVNFWRLWPRLDKVYAENRFSHPGAGLSRAALVAVSLAFEPWLIALGFWGLWEASRRSPAAVAPAWLFILATTAIHVVVVAQMRYRLPVMPELIAGASLWLSRRTGIAG